MKYSLAIFDLDGTLLNTLDDLTDSCNYILSKNNFPTHSKEKIKEFIGNGIPKLISRALPPKTSEKTIIQITKEFTEYYNTHSTIKTLPYPGIIELLTKLKQNKIAIAVNTNKHEQTAIELCNTFFPTLIEIVSGGQTGLPPKPEPSGVNKIINSLSKKDIHCTKDNSIFIGDSDVDIQTGNNAGIDSVGVTWGFRKKDFLIEHGAKLIANNSIELEKILFAL